MEYEYTTSHIGIYAQFMLMLVVVLTVGADMLINSLK